MTLVNILKRKDASSVMVAVVVAFIVSQPLLQVTSHLAGKISGLKDGQYFGYSPPNVGWKGEYLYPVVSVILQLILLEILAWLYIWAAASTKKK